MAAGAALLSCHVGPPLHVCTILLVLLKRDDGACVHARQDVTCLQDMLQVVTGAGARIDGKARLACSSSWCEETCAGMRSTHCLYVVNCNRAERC